jgi:glucose/arabinose dehydrogenase
MTRAPEFLLAVLLPFALRGDTAGSRPLNLTELQLPPGFDISIYARGVGNARMLAFSPSGVLFVSDMGGGRVRMVKPSGSVETFASGLNLPHGLAFQGNDLYVAGNDRIVVFRNAGGAAPVAGAPQRVADLPASLADHVTRTIVWTPDGKLLVTAGSDCNICTETNSRLAAALRFNTDGSGMEIFARGLRNSVGLAVHPVTGEIWGTDNGGDSLGDDVPPDEINILRAGNDYGWPRCYGNGGRYPGYGGDCSATVPP